MRRTKRNRTMLTRYALHTQTVGKMQLTPMEMNARIGFRGQGDSGEIITGT